MDLGTCEDDPDFTLPCVNALEEAPADAGGQPAGTCDSYRDQGQCDLSFCRACDYAGYCDLACGFCAGCEVFEAGTIPNGGGPQQCHCSSGGALGQCKQACDGLCKAVDEHNAPRIQVVPPGTRPQESDAAAGSVVDDSGTCAGAVGTSDHLLGRQQWFVFSALAGHRYFVSSVLVEGGLQKGQIRLHATDDTTTLLATAAGKHCEWEDPADGELGHMAFQRACVTWTCTASGEYAVEIMQAVGSGAVKALVQDTGDVRDSASREHLAVPVPAVTTGLDGTDLWAGEIGVQCTGTFCSYARGETIGTAVASSRISPNKLTADGTQFVMYMSLPEDATGLTLYFQLTASTMSGEPEPSASAAKVTLYPRAAAGGPAVYGANPHMSNQFVLGEWASPGPNHQSREQLGKGFYTPALDPDNTQYRNGDTDEQWPWVCPGGGEYLIAVAANCDVKKFDDKDTYTAGPDLNCESSFGLRIRAVDHRGQPPTTAHILHLAPLCTLQGGSACQTAQSTAITRTLPPLPQITTLGQMAAPASTADGCAVLTACGGSPDAAETASGCRGQPTDQHVIQCVADFHAMMGSGMPGGGHRRGLQRAGGAAGVPTISVVSITGGVNPHQTGSAAAGVRLQLQGMSQLAQNGRRNLLHSNRAKDSAPPVEAHGAPRAAGPMTFRRPVFESSTQQDSEGPKEVPGPAEMGYVM